MALAPVAFVFAFAFAFAPDLTCYSITPPPMIFGQPSMEGQRVAVRSRCSLSHVVPFCAKYP